MSDGSSLLDFRRTRRDGAQKRSTLSRVRHDDRGERYDDDDEMDIDAPTVTDPAALLDDFSLRYPLPFRILVLSGLTVLGFASNLHILSSLGIDTSQVLDIRLDHPATSSSSNPPPLVHPTRLYTPIYHLGALALGATTLAWLVYRSLASGLDHRDQFDQLKWCPAVVALALTFVCVSPWNWACRRQRFMFLRYACTLL